LQDLGRGALGAYNAPVHVFWVGKGEDVQEYPKTSSGKIQKVQLREIGNKLIGNE
jgi:acyl-coenzyme A synthetase/AMP-(fatty) acid ligase